MRLRDYVLNLLSPPKCISCNKGISFKSNDIFCSKCKKKVYPNNGRVCDVCGMPVFENADNTCGECKREKLYYDKNVSAYIYKGSIKAAIKNMKFKKRIWITYKLGSLLCDFVEMKYKDTKFDMIMYVPMTPLNKADRGFNQAQELAYVVSEYIGVPVKEKVIFKRPGTKTQSGLNKKERKENVKNAFIVKNPDEFKGKTILLIDDVFTTGSTVNQCSKLLKSKGAAFVYTATVAITIQ